jgi:hypothetical protein
MFKHVKPEIAITITIITRRRYLDTTEDIADFRRCQLALSLFLPQFLMGKSAVI